MEQEIERSGFLHGCSTTRISKTTCPKLRASPDRQGADMLLAKKFYHVFRISLTAGVVVALILCALAYTANHILVQSKINRIIKEDSRNRGIIINARLNKYYDLSTLYINVQAVTPPANHLSAIRIFFDIAREFSDQGFDNVIIASRGAPRLLLDGDTFIDLGEQYGNANPVEMLAHLAMNLRKTNGDRLIQAQSSHYAKLMQYERLSDIPLTQPNTIQEIFSGLSERQ
jgi:hypothetical protein